MHIHFLLGDPDDKSLRKVEREVIIPEKIRDKAKTFCQDEINGMKFISNFQSNKLSYFYLAFGECCNQNGFLMILKCRTENNRRTECLGKYYKDERLIKECTEEYLNERSEFRRTGIRHPKKDMRKEAKIQNKQN